ncbi:MAG: hypothetical protein ACJATO_001281, partial [Arenicella sp.]
MKYQIKASKNFEQKSDCLVVTFKELKKLSTQQPELNRLTENAIDKLQDAGLLTGAKGE